MLAYASLLALLPLVAFAQNTSTVCPPNVHDVQVGPGGNLVFVPNSLTAKVGDVVNFHYFPKNHSVESSAFATPCVADNKIFSGFFPTANGTNPKEFSITVTSTAPIWLFCGQTAPVKHCQSGMGMVINPPADPTKQITQYLAAAKNATGVGATVAPGTGGAIQADVEPNPACVASSTGSSGSSGNATVTSSPPVFTGAASTVGQSLSGAAAVLLLAAVALM